MSPEVPTWTAARTHLVFAWVQVVGGLCVLGSYAQGISSHPETAQLLWGAIPEQVWTPYSLCMPPAALGYLVLAWVLWTRLPETASLVTCTGWYVLFLGCSTAWMPLCFQLLDGGSSMLWWPIQGVLLGAAIALLALGRSLWASRHSISPGAYRLALVGWCFISWQCVVLDALVWPRFFPAG